MIDAAGLHVLPGVIDTQVHFREPGLEHKEDLETGSRAAVAGGVTAVFEMPNTKPLTRTSETKRSPTSSAAPHVLRLPLRRRARARTSTTSRRWSSSRPRPASRCSWAPPPATCWSTDEATLDRIIARISRRAAFHAEDEASRRRARICAAAAIRHRTRLARRGGGADATQRLVRLAEKHGKRVHVLHVSTAEEMAFLAEHKDWASVEVTPHHLTLGARCYQRLGTFAQMNPPVRDERHRQAIWAAARITLSAVDHAPHTREEKDHPYPESHSGMTGVQTLVPIMLDHVNAGRLTLERFVDLTSHGPQRLFGIRGKGRIAVGYDADLTIVDLKRRETITQRVDRAHDAAGRPTTASRAGLAGRHHRARPPRDVGRRDRSAPPPAQPVRFFGAVAAPESRQSRGLNELSIRDPASLSPWVPDSRADALEPG